MGLDQNAWAVSPDVAPLALITERELTDEEMTKLEAGRIAICYWRKHADLNAWMEALYIRKGGIEPFNCIPMPLTRDDIQSLKNHLDSNGGKYAEQGHGFFWGKTRPEDIEQDYEFIKRAFTLMDEGYEIYYHCWW